MGHHEVALGGTQDKGLCSCEAESPCVPAGAGEGSTSPVSLQSPAFHSLRHVPPFLASPSTRLYAAGRKESHS